jgi:nuclear pore complex protein Nup205
MATGTWAPFKELATIVNLAIGLRQPHVYYALDSILKKHKPDMYSLLKNPAPNQNHHLLVQKANQEGLTITNIDQPLFLPQDFIEEALLLSKILNLNELASVELLLAGERHQSDFPTLSRGLVAVLLYYDGRRNLVTSLRSLIQARDGISWTLGLTPNVVELVTSYTDSLFKDGLFGKIIKLLKEIDVEKELENLSKGRAIKDSKHRQQIVDLINETKQGLCECLFYWSCQCPLPKKELEEIITELKKVPVINEDQRLDSISVSLLFALLASFRISDPSLEPVGESNFDSSLSDDQHYPFHTDPKTLTELHKIIKPLDTAKSTWSNTQLEGCVKFAWAVFLRECTSSDAFRDYQELEDDELLLDESIELGAFQFLRQCIIRSKQFFNEEYYIRCLHHVIVNYIHLMPVKITELRNHGDEVAREEVMRHIKSGGSSLKMKQNFGEFMLLIGDLYTTDPNGLGLALDYWPSTDSNSAREHMRVSKLILMYSYTLHWQLEELSGKFF